MESKKHKHWIKMGIYYGYPKCCIENFCERGYTLTKNQELVHKNTGFTPCPKCSEKILSGETTLEGLLVNRICKEPFPEQ